jgi:fatty acid synthase subunit beta
MIAGGFDDISEEGSYEFANMKATSNAETEFAMGREPTEMSRPAMTSRAGVSSYELSTSNRLTNECKDGLQFAVFWHSLQLLRSTSDGGCFVSDKAGRSIPAPGRGALTVARQVPYKHPMPILDVAYRSRQLTGRSVKRGESRKKLLQLKRNVSPES